MSKKNRVPPGQRSKYDFSGKDKKTRRDEWVSDWRLTNKEDRESYLRRMSLEYGIDWAAAEDFTTITTSDGKVFQVVGKMEPNVKCEDLPPGQGCGIPSCPICMPDGGKGAYGGLQGGRDDSLTIAEMMDLKARELMFGRMYGDMKGLVDELRPPPPPRDTRLEQSERAAREKVKEWLLDTSQMTVKMSDIAGNEEAHNAMREAIEFPAKHAALYAHYGKKPLKGILLTGPPGCGKTMFGKAAATIIAELHKKQASMISIKATQLQQPYVGQTEQIIRNIFAYARAYHALHGIPLVIFIDEADAILPCRDGGPNARRALPWEESNVATFLSEMDGIEASGALVILATNRPEAIDPAIKRDGRIDRQIVVKRPDRNASWHIAHHAFQGIPLSSDWIDVNAAQFMVNELFSQYRNLFTITHEKGRAFFNLSHCVSGAMIVGLVERAKGIAFLRDVAGGTMTGVGQDDVLKAVDAVFEQQKNQLDTYALREFAQHLDVPILEINKIVEPTIKFAGTDTLQ